MRLFGLGAESIWLDEVTSLTIARMDLASVVAWAAGDIHPPLYYLVLHFWLYLGESEYALRALSALVGIACVAVVYALATEMWDRKVGWWSALLLALSPLHIWYSQEARMYGMATTLSLLSSYFLVLGLERQRASYWIGYVISAVLAIYTHYFVLFVFLFQWVFALYWLCRERSGAGRRSWLTVQVLVALLFLPWMPILYHQVTTGGGGWVEKAIGRPTLSSLLDTWIHYSTGLFRQVYPTLVRRLAYILFAFCSLLAGTHLLSDRRRGAALFSLGYVALPVMTIWSLSQVKPMYSIRYLLLFVPGYCMVLASGLHAVRGDHLRNVLALALIVILVVGAWQGAVAEQNPDWRGLTAFVMNGAGPDDVVLFSPRWNEKPFDYYSRGSVVTSMDLPIPVSDASARRVVSDLAERYRRIWLVWERGHYSDPQGIANGVLEAEGRMLGEFSFRGTASLLLYDLSSGERD